MAARRVPNWTRKPPAALTADELQRLIGVGFCRGITYVNAAGA
ncbi:MAG TPA: hypothetical protein VLV78_22150 [Thermoanaerobaculia bacterium]|nr:hypothetical protein [Thermoanaerobaculia bacterium]